MGDTVQLKNTQGDITTVPVEQAQSLLQAGYSAPTQEDLSSNFNQEKYGTPLEMAKTAGEGAVRGILPGGGALLNKFGDTEQAQAARKEANPITSTLSEVGGMGAGLLAGTGEAAAAEEGASALGKAAEGAKSIIGAPTKAISSLGHAVSEAVTPEAANLAQKAIGMGLGSAAEGAAYGLGQAVDDRALGDTDATGENLLHTVGYSALFAGALGGMMSPFSKEASRGEKFMQNGSEPFDAAIKEMPSEQQTGVIESLSKKKPGWEVTEAAAKDLGAPVLPTQVADSPTIQKIGEALEKRSDEVGIAYNNQVRDAYKIGSDAVENNLSNVDGGTAAETGSKIRNDLEQVIKDKYAPLQDAFSKIDEVTGPIAMAPDNADGIAKEMEQIIQDKSLPKNREKAKFIQDYADSVREASSASELDQLRSSILAEGREDYKFKSLAGNMADILAQAREKLGNTAINAMPEGEAKLQAKAIFDTIPDIKKSYGEFAQDLGRHSKKLGFGNNVGPGEFLSKLTNEGKISDEMITKKLLTKNDTGFLEFLRDQAPNSFQALMDQEKSRILGTAHKTGQFSAKTALREIEKLSPEMRSLIFKPEEIQKIESASHYLKSFPREIFASNTTTHANITEQFGGMTGAAAAMLSGHPLVAAAALAKHVIGGKITSLAMKEALERLGPGSENKVGALSMLEKMNGKVISDIASKSKALFDFDKMTAAGAGGSVLSKIIPMNDDKHSVSTKQITEYANNPQKLMDDLGKHTEPLYAFAPRVTGGLNKTAIKATNFLNSKLPKPQGTGPLGPKFKPSMADKAIFSNNFNTIHNPMHVLDKMKMGVLLPQDLEAVATVYPKLLNQMQQSVMNSMIDHVDKNGTSNIPNYMKVQLSLFLGQDMDSSLSQPAVAVNQAIFNIRGAQQDAKEAQQMARPSQKGLSSLNKSQSMLTNAQQVSQRDVES